MSNSKSSFRKFFDNVIILIILATIVYFIIRNPVTAKNILLVMLGFGAVIMIHEFGHFIVAKLSGIMVEGFSIGFPPTLLAFKRTEKGMQIRFLPKSEDQENESDEKKNDNLTDKAVEKLYSNKKKKAWETEYRIGMIPFGGYVKMLGQEDTGAVKHTDNPRSYANKPIPIRIAVVAAGVIFNAISALFIFMIVFMIGINLQKPIVGSVTPGSPADIAGIKAQDEILEMNGKEVFDFSDVLMTPALSRKGKEVSVLVRHPDGTEEQYSVIPEKAAFSTTDIKEIGVEVSSTLVVPTNITDPNSIRNLFENTGFRPGDVVKAVNSTAVSDAWQMDQLIADTLSDKITLTVSRTYPENQQQSYEKIDLPLYVPCRKDHFKTEYDLAHIFSIVPRLKLETDSFNSSPIVWRKKLAGWFQKKFLKKELPKEEQPLLKAGDIIIGVGEIRYPTYRELREATIEYANKESADEKKMPVTVLRKNNKGVEEEITVHITPYKQPRSDRVLMGIILPSLDMQSNVVAATIETQNGLAPLEIPRGAKITMVDGVPVKNFYEIAKIIRANMGQRISIDWRFDTETAGSVSLEIPRQNDNITAESELMISPPFELLNRKFKTSNPAVALKAGVNRTYKLIAQTYLTLRSLIAQDVSPKTLIGPVGIVSISYKIAKKNLLDYVYWLGLISSCIAVMNLLPLPVVDGGVIVMLIIEKIKGSPINQRTQEIISYIGLALILSLFLWVTYNDIMNMLFKG